MGRATNINPVEVCGNDVEGRAARDGLDAFVRSFPALSCVAPPLARLPAPSPLPSHPPSAMESASSSRSAITPSPSFLATPDSDDNLAGDKPDASLPMLHLDDDAHSTDGESDDGLLERGSIPLHALDGHGAATTHPEREGLLNDEDADDVVYNAFRGVNESSNTTRRKPRRPRLLLYSSEQEKKVVTRLDRYLVGGLALLYMLSFLDRSSEWARSNGYGGTWLMGRRYRQCLHCRDERGSKINWRPLRMVAHGILYHLHCMLRSQGFVASISYCDLRRLSG